MAIGMEDYDDYIMLLQNESPKIDMAMKNFISMLIGQSLTLSDIDMSTGMMISFTASQALACAKLVLKAIQSYELLDYLAYASAYPQAEQQTGLDRLDELRKYKALRFLRDRVITSKQSVNKFFGKSYFLWSKQWSSIVSSPMEVPLGVSDEQLRYFLSGFEQSLQDDKHIVWSLDFQEEVYKCSQQRKAEIQKRNSRVEVLEEDEDEDGVGS
jgi:hypothetical protein